VKARRFYAVSFLSGLVFAAGLAISGMTRPGKVLAFLDVGGAWDPTLAFVMAGAVAVHVGFALRAKRSAKPLFADRFAFPARDSIDAPLVLGAAIFGIGWGLQGYCPGPAVAASASGDAVPLVFLASMIVGLLVPALARALRRSSEGVPAQVDHGGATREPHFRYLGNSSAPAIDANAAPCEPERDSAAF
jgi:uncharacterized membrane protein YedE/YeeE